MKRKKASLPVDVRRSKTSLLKFPNGTLLTLEPSPEGNAGGHAQFLFQVELENDVRVHIFKISFAAICEFC